MLVEDFKNFSAFSEYMNFIVLCSQIQQENYKYQKFEIKDIHTKDICFDIFIYFLMLSTDIFRKSYQKQVATDGLLRWIWPDNCSIFSHAISCIIYLGMQLLLPCTIFLTSNFTSFGMKFFLTEHSCFHAFYDIFEES